MVVSAEIRLLNLKKMSIFVIVLADILSIAALFLVGITFNNSDMLSSVFDLFASRVMTAVSVVMLFLSALGLMGIIRESTFLTNVYSLCLLILLQVQVSASVIAFRMHTDPHLGDIVVDCVVNYAKDFQKRQFLDSMQQKLSCCGTGEKNFVNWEFKDLSGLPTVKAGDLTLPASCCVKSDLNKECVTLHLDSCTVKLDSWINHYSYSLGGCGMLLSIVQICSIVIATLLAHSIRPVKTRRIMADYEMGEEVHL